MGFVEYVGLVRDNANGEVTLNVQSHHLNRTGRVHGGLLATMMDTSIGMLGWKHWGNNATVVTVNLSLQYMRPSMGGRLVARAEALRVGGRTLFAESTVWDDTTLLAKAHATLFRIVDDVETRFS